jgi:multicomponent Na+:H+ antiporter subunit D
LFLLGALLLAAAPPFTAFFGKSLVESAASGSGYGWLVVVFVAVSALTGGAVLRVAGRVFLGWGPSSGPDPAQARAASERVDETRDERSHTPPMMKVMPCVLLVLAMVVGLVPDAVGGAERAAARFVDHPAYAAWVLHGSSVHWPVVVPSHVSVDDVLYGVASVLGALAVAGLGLFGRPAREGFPARLREPARAVLVGLRHLHSGEIGDYIAWWTAGASVLGGVCLVALG